ncbi:hypothetical protein F2Q69_00058860 [Brassica cretica]|uniref:Uncharacterized protein n=1 Tax=Brassica cretica TaxID=69181 RepID=A0A8S9RN36_BRACR|nr:hypothetical protein F2Q69_00058860 [Brassica cretica]
MQDVLSRAWAQVKWEEYVGSRTKAHQKQDPKTIRSDRTERDEKPSQRQARDCVDHSHKTEDCVALKIEVKKGHLREFLSEKANSPLSKETTGKPTEAAPVLPPRQDRVIHFISGGSEISGKAT